MLPIFKDLNHLLEILSRFSKVCNEMEEMTDALNRQEKSYQLLIFECIQSTYPELCFFCAVGDKAFLTFPISLWQIGTEGFDCQTSTFNIHSKQNSIYAVSVDRIVAKSIEKC